MDGRETHDPPLLHAPGTTCVHHQELSETSKPQILPVVIIIPLGVQCLPKDSQTTCLGSVEL